MKNKLESSWIGNGTNTPFYARKTFEVKGKVKNAKLSICGLGQFQFYFNGDKVSANVLDPAWTDYNKLVNYLTFDLTDSMMQENVIAVEVGNGWFIMDKDWGYTFHFPAFMPTNPNGYKPFSSMLMLTASLLVEYENGDVEYICTDSSWKVKEHMILHTNVFGSEIVDGRKRIPNWNMQDFDDSAWENAIYIQPAEWPKGELEEQKIPSIRSVKSYEGKYLHSIDGRMVFDFGQNVAGMLEFDVIGKKGDTVRIYPAEKLSENGEVDQMAKNWMPIDVCETYIVGEDDVWEHFAMTFTYVGARYIAVEGCSQNTIQNIKMHAISSAYEKAGVFTCDDERYMQIYDLVEKAVEANMLSVHTDCPTIERFAWQEENHLMAPSIMYMKQVKLHWEKFLQDTRISQHTAFDCFKDMAGNDYFPGEGLIPAQAPCYIPNVLPVPGMGSFYDIIGWGSSIILGVSWHYLFYGDKKIILDNYKAGEKYFSYLQSRVTGDGFINHGLGDWGNPDGEYARENVETALFYADAKVLTEFAEILGYEDDRKKYSEIANAIKENYNQKLLVYDEGKKRYCYKVWEHADNLVLTQATQALPLYWGIVPTDKVEDVVGALRGEVEKVGALRAGEVSQPYVIQSMARCGMNDLVCKCILNETHPSYYAFVKDGETTLGEYWEENPRSHCHDMMGHIIEWYYNSLAGIRPTKPGFSEACICPYLPESMSKFSCSYESASGRIAISVKEQKSEILLEVDSAPNIKVEIDLTNMKQRGKKIKVVRK